jgi:hypothetical protein
MEKLTRRLLILGTTFVFAPIPALILGFGLYSLFFTHSTPFTHQNVIEELGVIMDTLRCYAVLLVIGILSLIWGAIRLNSYLSTTKFRIHQQAH